MLKTKVTRTHKPTKSPQKPASSMLERSAESQSEVEQETDSAELTASKQANLSSASDVLKLQRTIGNQAVMRLMAQQGKTLPQGSIQRHPSHAEEQEVDRVIARHPSHAEEQEVDRVIARHTSEQQDAHFVRRTALGKAPKSRVQRTFGASPARIVMRVAPSTQQLNQKFQRTAGARFQMRVEKLAELAGLLSSVTTGGIGQFTHSITTFTDEIKRVQAILDDKNISASRRLIQENTKKTYESDLDKATVQKLELDDIAKEFPKIESELKLLANVIIPTKEQQDKLDPIEKKLEEIEAKVAKFTNNDQRTEIAATKAALKGIDTVVGDGFGEDMRHKIDKNFSALPSAHVGGNASLANISYGARMEGLGQASGYDYGSKSISITMPDNPITGKPMSEGMFTSLHRSNRFLRAFQDLGASEEYVGVEESKSSLFGSLFSGKRGVFSGNKTKKSPHMGKLANSGTLISWVIRHEMGHSVDQQIKFTKNRGKLDVFGGWREYENDQVKEVVQAMLSKAPNIPYDMAMVKGGKTIGDMLLEVFQQEHKECLDDLKKMQADAKNPKNASQSKSTGFRSFLKSASTSLVKEVQAALDWASVALSQPWMFTDGASDKLSINGRVYQRDHYGTWVSYLASARENALSSYQFSSPGEWFAEAYAAFYDPSGKNRSALTPTVVEWFKTNLGESGDKGEATLTKGGTLGKLEELDETKVDISNVGNSKLSDLPEDLKIMAKRKRRMGIRL